MKKSLLLFLFVSGFSLNVFSQYCSHRGSSRTMRLSEENLRSDTVDVINYTIALDITDFTNQTISGYTTVKFRPLISGVQSLSLDLLAMNIDSVERNSVNLAYNYNDTLLQIDLGTTLNTGDTASVTVYYNGSPQMDPSGWGGFYWSGAYAFNLGVGFQSIPHNFGRVWHPCFDNFVERATYDMIITTDGNKRAYCNGFLVGESISGSQITRTWKMETAIPTYLAAVNVAPYTHVEQLYVSPLTTDTIPMWLTALPQDTSNMKASFVNLDLAMEAFEFGYGSYVWNKVGFSLVPFSSGAMEHATNIAYPLATITGGLQYETLMAHELSHHWWGDLVTCETAEHMWINEGMASYSEKLFLEYVYGATAYFNEVRANHKSVIWKAHISDTGYFALSSVPQNVTYGATSYDKGADVVHTMRSYMGDSLFFAGMQTIIQDNQHQNITSEEFRDQLNAIPGVDVTDFFEGWVLNPGFPEFSIDSLQVVPSGTEYAVTVFVKQKLKAAPDFFNNVPINVFFRDENWNRVSRKITVSGEMYSATVTIPFVPVQWDLNEDEKISDAVTGDNLVIKSTGLKLLNHSNFQFNVFGVNDSAFVRVEQHWVPADDFSSADFFHVISPDRYWRISGVDFENIYTTAKLTYNGTNSGAGYLDNQLMVNHGSVLFHEDSLVILYRPNPGINWSVYPYFTRQTQASKTDKIGTITIDSVKLGDYAFGLRVGTVGINELPHKKEKFRIFPNPAQDRVEIHLNELNGELVTVQVLDVESRLLIEKQMTSKKDVLDVSGLEAGTYLIRILANGEPLPARKLIVY